MSECVICQGARRIRLPVHRPVNPLYVDTDIIMGATTIEESYRTYPCPECDKQAAEERIHVLYAEEVLRDGVGRYSGHGVDSHVALSLASATARKILEDGLIEIRKEERGGDIVYRSRLGVVSPRMVATMERRVFEKMQKFLDIVRSKAAAAISIWGFHYTGDNGMISKAQAIDTVASVFDRALLEARREIEGDRHGSR